MSRLITPSLFGSIKWARQAPPSWRDRALQSLHDMLARIWNDPNSAAQRGMDFENTVYRLLNSNQSIDNIKCSDVFKEILRECQGGQFQRKVKRFIKIAGEEYCLYGKIDVWFSDLIIDLKTTGEYKGQDKYLASMQHVLYCFIERIPSFRYIVVEFADDSNTIIDVHRINYTVEHPNKLQEEIEKAILDVLAFLEADDHLMELYLNSYSLY